MGGIIFGLLPVGLRTVAGPEVQWIVYGIFIVLVVFFLPRGIVPALHDWWQRRTGGQVRYARPAAAPALAARTSAGPVAAAPFANARDSKNPGNAITRK
ncbi:hypothetical protein D3C72_1821260 [compost metagenome]